MNQLIIKRGDIWLVEMDSVQEHGIRKRRPCIVISNWKNNNCSNMITIIPITSTLNKDLPTHVTIGIECGLDRLSVALCEQIQPCEKSRFQYQLGKVSANRMIEIKKSIDIHLGFIEPKEEYLNEAHRLVREIEELDRYLLKGNNREVELERELAFKNLNNYIVSHSLECQIDLQDYKNDGWEVYARTV